jgi:cell division control protein 45
MLDKQAIKTLRSFRLAVIKEGPDLELFSHPSTLERLAFWLVDAVRDLLENGARQTKVKRLPFVVASLDERRDCFLVVGVTGAAEYGDVKKKWV